MRTDPAAIATAARKHLLPQRHDIGRKGGGRQVAIVCRLRQAVRAQVGRNHAAPVLELAGHERPGQARVAAAVQAEQHWAAGACKSAGRRRVSGGMPSPEGRGDTRLWSQQPTCGVDVEGGAPLGAVHLLHRIKVLGRGERERQLWVSVRESLLVGRAAKVQRFTGSSGGGGGALEG